MPLNESRAAGKDEQPVHLDGDRVSALAKHREELLIDAPAYARELAEAIRVNTQAEVRFDTGSRAAYSTDASNYRQIPIGVVIPRTADDVVGVFAACQRFGAPITSRGGGTSLAGQCCNVAVVIDYSKYMNRVVSIDAETRTARVQPGCKLDTLRNQAKEHGLTFGPDPATHNHNSLGGMIGNNSCGAHSVMAALYGPGPLTEHNVESLDILLYDGTRMTVGPTSDESLAAIIQEGGRRGELYAGLRDLRDEYQHLIRERFPDIPRRVSGFNLDALLPENGFNVARALVGSEGTCVAVLEAIVTLIDARPERTLVVLGYPSIYEAGDHVPQIMTHKPVALEGLDDNLIGYLKQKGLHPDDVTLLPEGAGWLLVEFGDDSKEQADRAAAAMMKQLKKCDNPPHFKVFEDKWEEQKLWEVRESGLGATAHVPTMDEAYPGWEDAAVAPEHVGDYLREFRALLHEFGYACALYGHFGQGCIHCRITFDLKSEPGVQHWLRFLNRAADLVLKYGGSLSGEHGDGQARASLLPKMYGPELVHAFKKFKTLWDPAGKMNPGKVIDPYTPDQNLRHGAKHYQPREPETYFQFPADGGSFAAAVDRCVGVGKCRRDEGGVMCPSYMATRDEEHSTRGRSRMLFEMLQGDVLVDGLRDRHVRDALDLCLACKGCKHECPVNVDMATYKAEFLAHFYHWRPRPREAYAMGWIYWWARMASKVTWLVNAVATTAPLSTVAKWMGGVSPKRAMPTFASPNFTSWFKRQANHSRRLSVGTTAAHRPSAAEVKSPPALQHSDVPRFQSDTYPPHKQRQGLNRASDRQSYFGTRVLLWPDTFNNFLNTDAARATTRVLQSLGYEVEIPPRPLCCGRPLYDWGMLRSAKRLLEQTLEVIGPWIESGVPMVGIEPSCVAVFRDELIEMLPHRQDAQRLSRQTFLLSEFLDMQGFQPPPLHRKALVHGHCHHKSVIHMDSEVSMLKKMELDYSIVQSSCCGMAGAFGFSAKHYEVSVRIGEQALMPAVRAAEPDTLIIANGFSCQQQIKQLSGRQPLHLAQVIQMAIDQQSHTGAPKEKTILAS